MATVSEHLDRANENQRFLDEIDQARYPGWTVTAAFYVAVHLASALLTDRGIVVDSHTDRNQALRDSFPTIWKQYHPLYDLSRQARYSCRKITTTASEDALRRLERITRAVESLLP